MKLVYIEWEDSVSATNWHTGEDLKVWCENSGWIVKQVGWIIEETRKHIIIAGRLKPEDDFTSEQFGNLQRIPKTWVRKKIYLNKYII